MNWLLVVLLWGFQGGDGDTARPILGFREIDGQKTLRPDHSISINAVLNIEVDQGTLVLRALEHTPNLQPATQEEIDARTEFLSKIHEALKLASGLGAAYIALDLDPTVEDAGWTLDPKTKPFREERMKMLRILNEAAEPGSSLRDKLIEALSQEEASVPDEFERMVVILKEEVAHIGDELAAHLEDGLFSFKIVASHRSVGGANNVVGPSPYVTLEEDCVPMPFNRFNLLPDERAMAEYQFATQASEVVNTILEGKFDDELKAQIDKLKAIAREITASIQADLLDKIVADLKKLADEQEQASGIRDLLDQIRQIKTLVDTLDALSKESFSDPMTLITSISTTFNQLAELVTAFPRNLRDTIPKIKQALTTVGETIPTILKNNIREYLKGLEDTYLKDDNLLTDYFKKVKQLIHAYRQLTSLGDQTAKLDGQVKAVPLKDAVNASINLKDFCNQRAPGDTLSIKATITNKDGQEVVAESYFFTLLSFRWYIQTRGFLAFVNPDSDVKVDTQQNYMAAPAMAWYFKRDSRRHPGLNDLWSPGAGFAIMALDFNDNDSFEVGLSVSVTFLKNLLHVSYGRNLQTESDFFAIGLNPIVISKLFTK